MVPNWTDGQMKNRWKDAQFLKWRRQYHNDDDRNDKNIITNCMIMNNFQAGFTPAQVAKRKFLLLGFSSCALALSCVSFSAAVSVNFNYLIVCLSV